MEPTRLAAFPIFADLDDEDLAAIAAAASEAEAEVGTTLAAEGDFGYALYGIETGTAEVTLEGEHVTTLAAGDVFGEMAVLGSGRRTATVVATSPLRLIALFNRDVWALEDRAPDAIARLRALIAERRGVVAAD